MRQRPVRGARQKATAPGGAPQPRSQAGGLQERQEQDLAHHAAPPHGPGWADFA